MQTSPEEPWQWELNHAVAPQLTSALLAAPAHYRQGTTDLYAHLIATFGLDAWSQHAEMECIQYLWRCRKKNDYEGDIRKVLIICQRILEERGCGTRPH